MAETPEDPPKQHWSAAEYKRRVAERKANRTPEEKAQDDAAALSGLQRAAEQLGLGQSTVSDVFKRNIDEMHKASIEGARRARAARKADMEEAFANALKKSEKYPAGSLAAASSSSAADEIQKILDEPDLWDAGQSGIALEQPYSTRRWIQAKNGLGKREIIGMIAAVAAPLAAGIVVGSTVSIWNGVVVAVVTIAIELAILAGLYFWLSAREMDRALCGDLVAARNQLAEEKRKVRRIADAARQREAAMRQDHEAQCDALKQEIQKANEHKLLLEVAEGPWLNFMAKDTCSHVILFLASQSEMLPWIKPEIRIRFSNTDVHRTRLENVLIFLMRNAPKEPRYEIELPRRLQTEQGVDVNIDSIFVDARDKTVDYYLKADAVLENEWNGKFDEHSFLRIRMEAVGQRPYCVDLDVDWEQARKNEAPWEPGRVTIRKINSC